MGSWSNPNTPWWKTRAATTEVTLSTFLYSRKTLHNHFLRLKMKNAIHYSFWFTTLTQEEHILHATPVFAPVGRRLALDLLKGFHHRLLEVAPEHLDGPILGLQWPRFWSDVNDTGGKDEELRVVQVVSEATKGHHAQTGVISLLQWPKWKKK